MVVARKKHSLGIKIIIIIWRERGEEGAGREGGREGDIHLVSK